MTELPKLLGEDGDGPQFEDFLAGFTPENGDRADEDAQDLPAVPAITVLPPQVTPGETAEADGLPAPAIAGEAGDDSLLTAMQEKAAAEKTGITVEQLIQGERTGGAAQEPIQAARATETVGADRAVQPQMPDLTAGQIQTEYADSEIIVTDILEGNEPNQDITRPEQMAERAEAVPVLQTEPDNTESPRTQAAMARMPQMTGEQPVIPLSDSSEAEAHSDLERDNLSPLENMSDDGGVSEKGDAFAPQAAEIAPQRTAAAETLKAMADRPVSQENLFDTLVETMTLMEDGGRQSIQLQLKPAFLGKVSVVLVMEDGGIKAKIAAESQSVRETLGAELDALNESLAAKGVALTSIEVVEAEVGDMGFDRSSSPDKEPPREGNSRGRAETVDSVQGDESEDIWAGLEDYLTDETSTVEYRA